MEEEQLWHTIGKLSDLMSISAFTDSLFDDADDIDALFNRLCLVQNETRPDYANIKELCMSFFNDENKLIVYHSCISISLSDGAPLQFPNATRCDIDPYEGTHSLGSQVETSARISFLVAGKWDHIDCECTYDIIIVLCNNFVPTNLRSALLSKLNSHFASVKPKAQSLQPDDGRNISTEAEILKKAFLDAKTMEI